MTRSPQQMLLAFTLIYGAAILGSAVRADGKPNAPTRYRLIFNCDGHAVCKDAEGDVDQWIENLFGPLENSHVEALFWCDGAGGNTANYRSDVLEPTGKRSGTPRPWIKKLLDQGYDPPRIVVREAKKRGLDVFYSFRINDIHDSFTPDELATFKVDHPEWLIGERKYGDVTSFPTSLNFAVPEVRELKFRVIEEIFRKYDFDGLEIDFLRGAPYFLPGEEEKNAHLLTKLLRRIREHLNERGRQRGRSIRLAVRVEGSLASCRMDGFAVADWIEQGLIDYLILGSGVIDIEVEKFKKLAAPKGVLVYPCLYGWPSGYYPIPAELAVGLALNYWQQGADGLYLFNWFPHTKNNSEKTAFYMAPLLRQLGDPATLRTRNEQLMFAADRGRPSRDNPYSRQHCILPENLSDKVLNVSIRVGESFGRTPTASEITLQLSIDHLQDEDVVEAWLNGRPVEGLRKTEKGTAAATLRPDQLQLGRNHIALKLARRSPKSEEARTVTAVEIHMKRRAPIRVRPALFDQSRQKDLGLPTLPGEHTVIYRATKDGYTFCHHPNLAVFNNRLYAMWSNGKVDEDANGQRILGCSTADGAQWTDPTVIVADPDGPGPRAAVAAGFYVYDDTLAAFYTSIVGGKQINPRSTLYAVATRDGKSWGAPRKIATGFFIDGPRRMGDGRLLLNGQTADRQPLLIFSDSADGLSEWKPGVIPPSGMFTFPEPTWFRRPTGSLVMLFRTRSGHSRLYASVSDDRGKTWSRPMETGFPDATSRSFAGNLPDGTAYLISNPSTTPSTEYPSIGRRTPLTIALSEDGVAFTRAFVVRSEPTRMRFPGKNKLDGWQYPAAVAWNGWLYIAYSINKEDIGITRVRLEHLQQRPR